MWPHPINPSVVGVRIPRRLPSICNARAHLCGREHHITRTALGWMLGSQYCEAAAVDFPRHSACVPVQCGMHAYHTHGVRANGGCACGWQGWMLATQIWRSAPLSHSMLCTRTTKTANTMSLCHSGTTASSAPPWLCDAAEGSACDAGVSAALPFLQGSLDIMAPTGLIPRSCKYVSGPVTFPLWQPSI
jgi:hypothetical protein